MFQFHGHPGIVKKVPWTALVNTAPLPGHSAPGQQPGGKYFQFYCGNIYFYWEGSGVAAGLGRAGGKCARSKFVDVFLVWGWPSAHRTAGIVTIVLHLKFTNIKKRYVICGKLNFCVFKYFSVLCGHKINMSYFIFLYPRNWPDSKRGGSNIISKWFNCPNYRGSAITITRIISSLRGEARSQQRLNTSKWPQRTRQSTYSRHIHYPWTYKMYPVSSNK